MEHETDGNEREPLRAKPSRHSTIMRGIVTPIFGLLAVTCIVLGVMNATVWKPSPHVDARGRADSTYLVTDPGVLSLVNKRVTARAAVETSGASAAGSETKKIPICMALTTAQDARGWTSGQNVSRISGLDSWQSLHVTQAGSSGKTNQVKDGAVSFDKSDMWQQVKCGKTSVSMEVKVENPNQVILVEKGSVQNGDTTSGSKSGVTLEMLWERDQLPDFSMPFYFGGALLAVLALLSATVFAMEPSRRRKRNANKEEDSQEIQVSVAQALGSIVLPGIGRKVTKRGSGRYRRRARDYSGSGFDNGHKELSEEPSSMKNANQPRVIDPQSRNVLAEPEVARHPVEPDTGKTLSESVGDEYSSQQTGMFRDSDSSSAPGHSGHMTYAAARGEGSARTMGRAGSDSPDRQTDELYERVDGQSVLKDTGDDRAETSVISMDDMRDYLARFANEEEELQEEEGEEEER